jgi:chromosome segregation protein
MPRDATETERRAMLACEELARVERRLPTVKRLMDTLGIQSPEVVGRALKRWREGFIERALAEDTHLGLPIALVQPLKELMALAQAEASREIEGARAALDARRAAMEEDLTTARTARDEALKRAEAADQALALFQTVATEERQGQAARIADLERRLDAAIEARALAERTLATEAERRAELDRRLAMERTRFQDEKLYLAGEHAEAMEALGIRHQEELTWLKGALTGLEVANKRQHEDLSIERAREKQAEDQVATLRGQQHEQDRVIAGLREALAAREAALADAEARATQAQARAALLEADLIAARSELSALRAEEARLRVALAEARTELTVVERERGAPRKGRPG